ncbi:cytoskeleton-associated protein [Cordyceps javanica]|uniref:Cytoskeleton-associated protein n=1 Tax=Cordyceps javanica TaxID=43265 RepID=A0A545W3X2_9HYPO|nr:cytoskeleton-associated protein [Cordyceps javanica]TQW08605.1 cytoskeleton-associated protein [Cordyceps javanica]
MVTVLTMIRDDNEIPASEPKTQYITQDTEDALQLHTLTKLLEHPDFSIRDIATKILCDRAVNDPGAMTYLLYGITVKSYDERLYCLRALSLLTNQTFGLDGLSKLNTPKAYSALVRSLERSLGDGNMPVVTNIHWDEYYLRDTAERFCLKFLQELTSKYGATLLVKAKFVEKWLGKQEWGDTPEARKRNFKAYKEARSNRVVDIVNRIEQCRRGLRALEKSGLVDKDNSRRRMRELPDLLMEVGYVIGEAPPTDIQLRRAREHSAEERRLRRQHREAMVLNDGSRPLAREDIIERDHGSPS